ncbi:MAG: hypothetical protein AB7V50_09365, partial [Vampirovibrionia bacterium]
MNKEAEIISNNYTFFLNLAEAVVFCELVYNDYGEPINYRIIDGNYEYENLFNLKRSNVKGKLATDVFITGLPP